MEVADRLLDHALCRSSITVKHIQSNLSKTQNLLITKFDIGNIEGNSNKVFYGNTIDLDFNRSEELMNLKYMEFNSNYVRDFNNCKENDIKFRKITKSIMIRV